MSEPMAPAVSEAKAESTTVPASSALSEKTNHVQSDSTQQASSDLKPSESAITDGTASNAEPDISQKTSDTVPNSATLTETKHSLLTAENETNGDATKPSDTSIVTPSAEVDKSAEKATESTKANGALSTTEETQKDESEAKTDASIAEVENKGAAPESTDVKMDSSPTVKSDVRMNSKPEDSPEKPKTKKSFKEREQERRQHLRDTRHNIKSDYTSLEKTDDPETIRNQVHFYFSWSNLMNDEFLFTRIGGHANKPIALSLVHSFKRMRRFESVDAVTKALQDSDEVDIGFFNKDEPEAYYIRRKTPLPKDVASSRLTRKAEWIDKSMSRSIYAKGFGHEEVSSQFKIEEFFKPFGPIAAVRLRRDYDQGFKGSVFVEFADEETMKNFMDLAEKPKYKGEELMWKTKQQYVDEKAMIYGGKPSYNKANGNQHNTRGGSNRGRGARGGNRGRGRGNGGELTDYQKSEIKRKEAYVAGFEKPKFELGKPNGGVKRAAEEAGGAEPEAKKPKAE